MSKSLNYRRDGRTIKQFEKDIKNRTKKEKFLIKVIEKEWLFRGHTVKISDYGIDNSGKLIKGNTKVNADYKIVLNGEEMLCDVKNSGVDYRCTFKTYLLEQYVKNKVHILLFYNTGFIDDNPTKINYEKTRWALISPKSIKKMLKLPHYKDKSFGYKMCVQVNKRDYSKYFTSYNLNHKGVEDENVN